MQRKEIILLSTAERIPSEKTFVNEIINFQAA